MAAFSAYKQPVTMDGVFGEFMPNFQQFYSAFGNCQENSSFTASAHESSCVEQQSLTSLPEKQRSESLSMADKAESGEQVAQNCVPAADKKKRKSRNGSSLTSANSKDYAKQIKSKKQKGDIKVEAKNEEKNDKKDQTKSTTEVEPPKDYIHVRARRGQATDSHSLAERVRREKISERMRTLQAIVPGCDKVTGKALMLDEIINYVQSLQNQVEFLSLKLSSLDPMVYTFGLMDLDPIAFGADVQGMNNSNMGFPIPFSAQSVSGSVSGSDSPPAQVFATANSCLSSPATSSTLSPTFPNNPHVDCSANLLRHDQKPIFLPTQQDAGSLYWEVNEQERQNIINQFGLFSGNNLYSLH